MLIDFYRKTKLMIAKPKTYRGAGTLFWFRDSQHRVHVLLGQRCAGKNWWSIPGGGMSEEDGGNFSACAIRETREEFGWPPDKMVVADSRKSSVVRFRLPGYCWNTYLCELAGKPEERAFPDTNSRDYRHEFLGHKWFPLRLGVLPWRLNILTYPVLLRLLLKGQNR